MTVGELRAALTADPAGGLHLMLPTGEFVPAHFHVTEVGRVRKDFIDCGGTVRASTACVVQTWVADDTAHRLTAGKLAAVLRLADRVLGADGDALPVEVEYETGVVSQYPLTGAEVTPAGLLLVLGGKHTACLAPDRCGVPLTVGAACGPAGCC